MRLWLTSDRRSVLIQVWDGDQHRPRCRNAGPDAEAGRGLLLVEALSVQWGCYAASGPGAAGPRVGGPRMGGPRMGGLGVGGLGGKVVWALCAE